MDLSGKHYLNHLTEVNSHNKVVLSRDIYNDKGVLVVKKGVEVNKDLTYKIAKHKLAIPIDESIALSNSLSYKKVIDTLEKRLEKLNILSFIKELDAYQDTLNAFKLISRYPAVIQKLSVLENRFPDIFSRSLTSSGIALSICKELNLSRKVSENVFLATLISDVGLLHIDPEIVNKEGQYSAQEWKMMQGHVAIAKHFADQIEAIPSEVSRALIEHHERDDGYGYPFGKKGEELCIEGQIIAIVDKVSGLVKKLITNDAYSWKSIIHVMQIPSTAHSFQVHNALMRVLKRIHFPYQPAFPPQQFDSIVEDCILRRQRLTLWFEEFSRIYVDHKEHLSDSGEFKPLGLLSNLEYTVTNTGLLNESQDKWLKSLQNSVTQKDYEDIEEFALLLTEIEYRCFFVMRKFEEGKDELLERVGNCDLLLAYQQGLQSILKD